MTSLTPRDPAWRETVAATFAAQPFMRFLGVTLAALAPGRAELRLPYRDDLTQQHRFFHGGVMGTLADNAAGAAAATLLAPGLACVTAEYKMNILAPGVGEALIARAEVIRPGRTLTVARVDVLALNGGEEKLCATALATLVAVSPTA